MFAFPTFYCQMVSASNCEYRQLAVPAVPADSTAVQAVLSVRNRKRTTARPILTT